MEAALENPVKIKDELGYRIARLVMGSGYTRDDHRWNQLTNQIVKLHKNDQPVPDELASEHARLTEMRAKGRPNETPL